MATKKTTPPSTTQTSTPLVRLNAHSVQLTLSATASDMSKARSSVMKNLIANVRVPGFRPGVSVPENVLIKHVGETRVMEMVTEKTLDSVLPKALIEHKLRPVAPAKLVKIISASPLEALVEIEIFPEIIIDEKKLTGISVKKTEVKITDKDVDAEISEIEKSMTHYHHAGVHSDDGADTSNESIVVNDRATVDAQGFEKKGGKIIPETKVTGHALVIGSKQFIPGFEEELIGAKKGDVVEFDITFPADYHSEAFKSKKVHFVVTILEVEKPHLPEWNEETIEQVSGVKQDMKAFRAMIKANITAQKESEARQNDESILLGKLLEVVEVEPGPSLVARECETVLKEQEQRMQERGLKIKDFLTHTRQSMEEYTKTVVAPEATRRLKAELVLNALQNERKVVVEDTDVKVEIERLLEGASAETKTRVRERLVPGNANYEEIKQRLAFRRIVESFFETSKK